MRCSKKNLLVLGPILPQWSEIKSIVESLSFLDFKYNVDYLDPLPNIENLHSEKFLANWQNKLSNHLNKYDAFIGFSLGGVIIQQSFEIFHNLNKSIILFSTPSFSNDILKSQISKIIGFLDRNLVKEAIRLKNEYVFFPNKPPIIEEIDNLENAKQRLLFGLAYILQNESRLILKKNNVKYMHLIGEESQLVNQKNVEVTDACQLITVSKAGMRMLQSNPTYCRNIILRFLEGNY